MSSIGSIGSSSAYANSAGGLQKQRPDPSKMVDNVFSKLDTKGQGYLEVADLESAFNKITSNTTSGINSTATATATSNPSSGSASSTASVDDLFKKLDSNGDGKVTKSEFSSGLKKLSEELESQFNTRRSTGTQGANGTNRPPPPPPGGDKDGDQDNSVSQSGGSTSNAASATGGSKTYAAADANQDGTVTIQETLAYIEKTAAAALKATTPASSADAVTSSANSTGTASVSSSGNTGSSSADSGSSTSNSEAALFKKIQQLLHAYADPYQAGGNQNSGGSISISA
ncbi:hypothetical protein BH11PSE12_BH11PSE12_28430 [soil metagenome]